MIVEPAAQQPFDRGWVKNVGFCLAQAGPWDSVYFHDVDTIPVSPRWFYPEVPRGKVQHLYGHRHCLGGIVGVDPAIFCAIGGFVHSDRWGGEDRALQFACEEAGVPIVRDARFQERFRTSEVVELNLDGTVQPKEEGLRELKRKWAYYVPKNAPPGLWDISFSVEAQIPTISPAVRHFVIGKKY